MITNFKIFENIEFKIGDYVKTYYSMNLDTPLLRYNKYFKIMYINFIDRPKNKNAYSAEDIYGVRHHLNDNDIERKMTQKEIENFEIYKNRIKYNL